MHGIVQIIHDQVEGILLCESKPIIISPSAKQAQNMSWVRTQVFGSTVKYPKKQAYLNCNKHCTLPFCRSRSSPSLQSRKQSRSINFPSVSNPTPNSWLPGIQPVAFTTSLLQLQLLPHTKVPSANHDLSIRSKPQHNNTSPVQLCLRRYSL